jgi:hypothetical protein
VLNIQTDVVQNRFALAVLSFDAKDAHDYITRQIFDIEAWQISTEAYVSDGIRFN